MTPDDVLITILIWGVRIELVLGVLWLMLRVPTSRHVIVAWLAFAKMWIRADFRRDVKDHPELRRMLWNETLNVANGTHDIWQQKEKSHGDV